MKRIEVEVTIDGDGTLVVFGEVGDVGPLDGASRPSYELPAHATPLAE
jgi:hypothetical protein